MLPKIVYWAKFKGKVFFDANCHGPLLQRSPLNREDGCVGGDWKPLSGLIREPGQGTFTLIGNLKKPMAAATMLM